MQKNEIINVTRTKPTPPRKVRIKEGDKTLEDIFRNLGSAGFSDKDMSDVLGCRLKQLRKRLKEVPVLQEALVEGRSEATQNLIATLYQVAMGGHVTQKIKERFSEKGDTTEILTEEHPPNPQMIMFWLTNVASDDWKYSRQLQKEDAQGLNVDGQQLESDKIARLSREIFTEDTDGAKGEHRVSEATPHTAGEGTPDEGDLCADVPGETADNIQDDVLDVPTETGTEHL
jgi:hypothetical protein